MNLDQLRIDLAAAGGAGLVGFLSTGVGSVKRNIESKLRDEVNVNDYGAICDGVSRPLSTLFASLGAAQAVYPSASALTDQLDSVAIQTCFDNIANGTRVVMRGVVRSNKTLFLNKSGVTVDARGCTLRISAGPRFSLVIHGPAMDRSSDLDGPVWLRQILTQSYETAAVSTGVKVIGLRVESATGGRLATQMMCYFADDCELDGVSIKNSDGSGVEFRNCVNPRFTTLTMDDIANFGLFVYQCHGLVGGTLKIGNSGRVYDIKQRHKFFESVNHHIDHIIATDMRGVGDPAWATSGRAYNDLLRAGYDPEGVANRNFPGHEICRLVTIDRIDCTVTNNGAVNPLVTGPSIGISAFSDKWTFGEINLEANGKPISTTALVLGAGGDIPEGIAGGATFGSGHVVESVNFSGYNSPGLNGLVVYAVNAIVRRANIQNCSVRVIVDQSAPALLPFGKVDRFEFTNLTGNVKLALGPYATGGVLPGAETTTFISGGAQLNVTPINSSGSDTVCTPWYVRSVNWVTKGRDEITLVDGGVASNHTTSYVFGSAATSGRVSVKVSAFAPAHVRALSFGSAASTRALVIDPCEFILTGTLPTGEKTAIYTVGEVSNAGGHIFTGGWSNTISDTSWKNAQNLRRTVYLTAAPTTGVWQSGDRTVNIAPSVGNPKAWLCTADGTPGTWVSEGNL